MRSWHRGAATRRAESAAPADAELLRRFVATGDEIVFSVIVGRHAGHVYAACLRVLCDTDRAEDAAQETFLRLARRADLITQSLGGWLHRTATHIAFDRIRSDERRRSREAAAADLRRRTCPSATPGSPHTHPEARASARELIAAVDAALLDLDDSERELLHRHFFRGQSIRAIAAEDGAAASTTHRRLRTALDRLQVRLQHRGVSAAAIGGTAGLAVALAQTAQAAPVLPPALADALAKITLVSGLPLHPPAPVLTSRLVGFGTRGALLGARVLGLLVLITAGALAVWGLLAPLLRPPVLLPGAG